MSFDLSVALEFYRRVVPERFRKKVPKNWRAWQGDAEVVRSDVALAKEAFDAGKLGRGC